MSDDFGDFHGGLPNGSSTIDHTPDHAPERNLSTHTAGAMYETFPAQEARRILQRLEFHYTPNHTGWLNMVEIEIGVPRGQCLNRRIGDHTILNAEIAALRRHRNASGARIKWKRRSSPRPARN
jgi:DDE superfamily endonuclease